VKEMRVKEMLFVAAVFVVGIVVGRTGRPTGPSFGQSWSEIRGWAVANNPYRGRSVDMHDVDVFQIALRKKLGPLLATLDPSTSGCQMCQMPWTLVAGHDVSYARGRARFSVCEQCWRQYQRLGKYDELVQAYVEDAHRYDPSVEAIMGEAVRADLAGKPLWPDLPMIEFGK
jgi:hypothetical protein